MKLLFLTARFPYPPLKGDQVRSYHYLRLLSRNHKITLISFVDREVSTEALREMQSICEQVITVPLQRSHMFSSCLYGMWTSYPFQTLIYQSPTMVHVIQQQLSTNKFDLVHVQLARMAPYLEFDQRIPRVIDLIDALSVNMERRYRRDKSPLRYAAYLEWQRLRQYEQTICRLFDQVIVVSQTDKEAIGDFQNLHTNPIGVDLSDFPFTLNGRQSNSIVFSGNMSYFPNIDAVFWFVNRVLPLIRVEIPDVHFYIVGTNPHSSIRQMAQSNSAITVTGYVPKVQSYLAQAAAAVVPMQAGSGMQFKVIEAMACGTPVIVTPYALGGLQTIAEKYLLVGDTPQAFANHVICLIRNPLLREELAIKARALVEEYYAWDRIVSDLESIYSLAIKNWGNASTII